MRISRRLKLIISALSFTLVLNACSPFGGADGASTIDRPFNPGLQAGTSTVSAANSLIVSNSSNVTADGNTNAQVTITLLDDQQNPIPGEIPTFSASDLRGTNTYHSCTKSDPNGISTCSFSSRAAENKTLQLLTPGSFSGGTVNFVHGPATSISFSTNPVGNVIPGAALSTQPIVTIYDQYQNIVNDGADGSASVALSLTSGTGILGGTTTVNAVNGIATFSGLSVDTQGSKVITATKASTAQTGVLTAAAPALMINTSVPGPFSITSASPAGSGSINLVWGASSDAATYTVSYGTASGVYGTTSSTSATSPYTLSGLSNSQTYYIMVTAVNASGSTNANAEVSAVAATPPTTPTLTLSATPGSVALSWAAVSGTAPITYTVKRSTTSGSAYTSLATGISGTTYTDATVANGTQYYYVVEAINAGGTTSSIEKTIQSISSFTITSVTQSGNGQAQIAWAAASGASTYTVKYGTSTGVYGTTVSTNATSPLTVNGLTNGSTYYFMVVANNAIGSGTSLNATSESSVSLLAVPSAPASLTAIATPGSVALSWTLISGSGTLTYSVYRSTTSGSGYVNIASNLSATTYTDATAVNGTTYYYVVNLSNISGTSGYSNEASVKPISTFAISSLTVNGSGSLAVAWNAATGTSSYSVKYGTATGVYGTTASTNATSPYSITGLTPGTPYYVMVTANNTVGAGTSQNANAEISGTPLSAFTISSSVPSTGQSILTWGASTGATSYDISYGTASGVYTTATLTNKTSPFTVTGLSNGTTYYFMVTAKNASGSLNASAESSSLPIAVPSVPASVTGVATHNQVALSWAASSGSGTITYNVYRSTTSGSYGAALATGLSSASYTDTAVTDGTVYYYVITASNAGGESADSSEFDAEPINNFSLATLSTGNSTATLSWGSPTGATSYDIKYGTVSGTYGTTVSNQTSGASVSSLTPGTTYYFRINAKNAHHGLVISSNELSGTPVSGFAISGINQNGAGSVAISWGSSTGATSYDVKYGTSSGSYGSTLTNQTSPLTIVSLSANQTYYFMVTANNGSGSINSAESSVSTLAIPSAPASLAASATPGSAALTWNTVAGPGSITYSVYRSTTSGSYGAALATGLSSAAYTDATAANGTTYYYVATANNLSGESSHSSEISVKPIAAFTISSVTVSAAGSLQVAWNAVSGASAYTLKYGTSSGVYGTTVSTSATSPTTISSLTSGTPYYFMVVANNSVGSGASVNATSEMSGTPLSAFTIASAVASSAQTVLTWNASTGVSSSSSYDVKYGTAPGTYTTTLSNKSSPYTVTGLTNSSTYYFIVVAKNASGSLNASAEVSANPIAVPTTPSTLTGQGTHNNSALAWVASTGSGSITYNVYRSSTSGSGYSSIATGLSSNFYNDATAVDGSIYYYVVTASNAGGETVYSNEVSVEPINSFLLSTASPGNQQVTLSWASPTGATSYDVKYGTATGVYGTTLTNQTSPVTITSLTAGTAYYFSVTAKNTHNGLVIATNELSATPFAAFTISSASQSGGGQVAISWAASTGATSYDVKYGTATGVYGTTFSNTAGTSTTVTGLSNTQTYYFMITAKNAAGSINASAEASVAMIDVPSVPGTLAVTGSNTQNVISWAASSGSGTITYNVLRSTTSGSGYAAVSTAQSGTSFSDTGLTNGTTYYYVIQSSNIAGNSANSAEISGRPIANFSISSVTAGITQATVAWSGPTGASTYTVYYSTTSGSAASSGTAACAGSASSPCVVTGLTGGTTYYFAMVAVNANNGKNTTAELSAMPMQSVTYNWTFDTGTSSSYTFDASKIELATNASAQVGRLQNLTPNDSSNSTSAGFGAGTMSGVKWDSVNSKLTLDSTTDDGELNATWTPQYSNIVGYWKLNGTSGTSITQGTVINSTIGPDGVFQNANASTYPTTGYTSGKLNQATTMDGVDDYIKLQSPINIAATNFTVSIWINPGATTYLGTASTTGTSCYSNGTSNNDPIPAMTGSGAYTYAGLNVGTNGITVCEQQSGLMPYTFVYPATLSGWNHIVMVNNNNAITVYLNGNSIGSTLSTGLLRYFNLTWISGGGLYHFGTFNGSVDELSVWKSALAASEVKTLYERQNARYTGSLLSRVMNIGASSSWSALNFSSSVPYSKAIPNKTTYEDDTVYNGISSLTRGLVGSWRLNEPAGSTTVADVSTSNISGTPSNVTFGGAGKYNTSASFDGSSSLINNGSISTYDFGTTTSFTISSWAKWTAATNVACSLSRIFSNGSGPNGSGKGTGYYLGNITATPGQINFAMGDGSSANTTNDISVSSVATNYNDGTWHHISVSIDQTAKTIKLYVDGSQIAITSPGCGTVTSNTLSYSSCSVNANHSLNTYIGAQNGSCYWNGSLSDVNIWNRALSSSEISTLYSRTTPVDPALTSHLAGLWHLDESSWNGTSNEVIDSSGFGNHGTAGGTTKPNTITSGIISRGGQFYGISQATDSYVNIPSSSSLDAPNSVSVSAWIYQSPNDTQGRGDIFWHNFDSTANNPQYDLEIDSNALNMRICTNPSFTGCLMVTSTTTLTKGKWIHAVGTWDGNTAKLYLNGVLSSLTGSNTLVGPLTSSGSLGKSTIGAPYSYSNHYWPGNLDEVGVWTRALSATEVQQLYQRGANRTKFQIRTCSTSDCSDDATQANWKGPSGDAATYFSELFNMSTQAAAPSGNVLATSPAMTFANFTGLGNQTAQYFQYKAILESDSSSYSPDITQVSAGPARYDGSSPIIVPIDGPAYQALTGFSAVVGPGSCSGTAKYQLSRDKSTWYYYSGGWSSTTGGYTNANDAATVNTNIATFASGIGTGKLYVKAFLPSDTTTACEIDSITVNAGHTSPSNSANPGSFQLSSIVDGTAQVTLNWSASSGATAYTVCYGTTQALADACGTTYAAGASTSATITGLTNNTTYYFTVSASNASGSTVSNPTSAVINSATPMATPTTPTALAASAGVANIGLTWTGSTGSGTITYNVQRSTTNGSGYATLASGVSTTAYTDLTALAGTTYYYVVSASNAGGSSANSTQASAAGIGTFTTSAVATNTTAVINWTAATGATATNYTVQWGTSSGTYTSSATGQSQASGYTITGLTNGTTYYVLVTAKNGSGSANAISEIQVRPIANFAISSITPGITSASVAWTGPTGASTYTIKYSTTSGQAAASGTAVCAASSTSPCSVTGLTGGTTYYFAVLAVNATNGAYTTAEVSAVPYQAFTYNDSFASGTGSSNTISSNNIDVNSSSVLELTPLSQTDNSSSASTGFGGGTFVGISSYGTLVGESSSNGLKLGSDGSCNGSTTNCNELSSTWTPQWSSLVSYWKLNESAGTSGAGSIADSKGTNTGTPTSVTFGGAGKLRTAANFNGTSSTMTVSTTGLSTGSSPFTYTFWLNTSQSTGSNYITIFAYGTAATNKGLFIDLCYNADTNCNPGGTLAGRLMVSQYGNGLGSNVAVNDGKWHHAGITFDGTTYIIYIDGVASGSKAMTTNITNSVTPTFGKDALTTGANYNGSLDDFAMWNKALTANEITQIYNTQSATYGGGFTSRVMDALSSQSWTSLAWTPTLPFFKALPDYTNSVQNETSTAYSSLQGDTPAVGDNNLMNGIVGLWHLDEASGTTGSGSVKDTSTASGSANNGTPTSVTFGGTGKFNTGASFNGSSSYINVGTGSSLSPTSTVTVSAWINKSSTTGYEEIVSQESTTGYQLGLTGNNLFFAIKTTNNGWLGTLGSSAAAVPLGSWVHVVGIYDGVHCMIYVNGTLINADQVASTGSIVYGAKNVYLGNQSGSVFYFNGLMDEVAIWNKALNATEVKQLYQRGASRLKFQVRSCSDSTCTTGSPSWQGPDGTSSTYFTELDNMSTQAATPSGTVNATAPSMTLQNYTSPVGTNRYFQYRTIFESDSSTASLMPELKAVTVGPNHYDTTSPAVIPINGPLFTTLTGFTVTLGTNGCSSTPKFQLSTDKVNWYYWNGSAWVSTTGTYASASDATTINANIGTFAATAGTGYLYVRTFLPSSGTSACEISNIAIAGANATIANSSDPGNFTSSVTATNTQATLTWTAATSATSYTIKYGTATGVYGTTLTNQTSPTTITGLSNNTPYYFMVYANDASGSTPATFEVSATPIASFTPTTSVGIGTATITWTAPSGASTYAIQYGTTSGTYTTTLSAQTSPTTISSLTGGTTYYFRVQATNANNGLTNSSEVSTVPLQSFTYNSPFTSGTSSSYTISSSNIDLTSGGVCELTPLNQTDNSSSASTGFGAGTFAGISAYGTLVGESASSGLKLGSDGTCNGSTANQAEFNSCWTPAWANGVAYLKLNETSGTSAADSVGTCTGTHTNTAISGSSGKLNLSSVYNGTTAQYTTISMSAGLTSALTSSYSISLWVKPTGNPLTGNYQIAAPLGFASSGSYWSGLFWEGTVGGTTGNFVASVYASTTGYSANSGSYSLNQWHHLVMVTDDTAKTLSLYVDGALANTTSYTGTLNGGNSFSLGKIGNTIYGTYTGNVDEAMIWNTTLTAAQVKTIYDRQSTGIQGSYGGYYTSRVFDATASQSWTSLAWTPTLPFFKGLPDYASSAIQNETSTNYSSLNTNTLMSGIVGLWHLDEASGTTGANVIDNSGQARNGTPSNVTFGVNGRINTAAYFNGTNSNISLGNTTSLDFGTSNNFTLSMWLNWSTTATNQNAKAFANGGAGFAAGYTLLMKGSSSWGSTPGRIWFILGSGSQSSSVGLETISTSYNDGNWHHVVVTADQTSKKLRMYVDGTLASVQASGSMCSTESVTSNVLDYSTCSSVTSTHSGSNSSIGSADAASISFWNGNIDEVAVWSRSLASTEVTQLYQRGASRIKFQVRSCSDSTCTTGSPTWQGPDGTSATYFSEIDNMSTQAATPSGTVNATLPSLTLNTYTSPVGNNRYFQYRTIFESDSSTTSLMPELKAVTVGPNHYDSTTPAVIPINGPQFTTLSGFTVSLGTNGCSSTPKFQLSTDKVNWYYWNGSAWITTTGTYASASDATTINTNIGTFAGTAGTGYLYVRTFLPSSGSSACEIDNIAIAGGSGTVTNSSDPGNFTSSVTAANTQATLTWTAASSATSYTIRYGTTSGVYTSTALNQTSPATITGLTNNTPYYFIVYANDASGSTPATYEVSATPIASFTPTTSVGIGTATITWTAPSGASTYAIKYGTTSGTYTTTLSGQTSPTTISSLTGDVPYYFIVQATNANNGLTNSTEVSATPTQTFSYNWPFTSGTTASYSSSSSWSNTDFTSGGVCELTPASQTDNSSSASTGFGGGTFVGISAYGTLVGESSSSGLKLGNNGSCNGSSANCANSISPEIYELNSNWAPQWSSLVGYWKLNDASGSSSAIDSKGSHAGTAANITYGGTGKVGSAASFNGTSSSITIPAIDLTATNKVSASLWYYSPSTPTTARALIENSDNYNNYTDGFLIDHDTDGYIYCSHKGNANYVLVKSTAAFTNNIWNHILCTFDKSLSTNEITMYINGVATGAISGGYNNNSTNSFGNRAIYIGNRGGASLWANGYLDDVAIWSTSLSATEVATVYNQQTVNYSGVYTSRVMDALSSQSWTSLAWTPTLPFFKALPDYASSAVQNETSTSYSSLQGDTPATGDNNLMTGIVGLWHLDEALGTTGTGSVKDSSGNNKNATPSGVTLGASGKFGSAVKFAGSGSVSIPGGIAAASLSKMTFSAWIQPTTAPATNWNYGLGSENYFRFVISGSTCWNVSAVAATSNNGWYTAGTSIGSSLSCIPYGTWAHILYSYDGSALRLYVNGALAATGTAISGTVNVTNQFDFSISNGSNLATINGSVDEVAIWSKALNQTEITQLYQRGASRLKFQVRTCSDSTCTTGSPTWKGPDGTSATYFSELDNMSTQAATPSGTVNATTPSMTLQNYTSPVGSNRYFQYRTIFESDSSTTTLMPELKAVTVGPNHYDSSTPTVYGINGSSYVTLTGFTVTLGGNGCSGTAKYQLSKDKSTWYYWNGSAWVSGSAYTSASDAATINTNISTFPATAGVGTGTIYVRAYLPSTGAAACEIDNINVTGTQ